MPLADITKPEMIRFLIESYDKTTLLRLKWNQNNADKVNFAATLQREEKGYYDTDVSKASILSGLVNLKRDYKSSARNKLLHGIHDGAHIPGVADMRKGHSIVDVDLGDPKDDPRLSRPDSDLTIDPIMRPVEPKQKNILYKGKPEFGRAAYLKNRSKVRPEDRYYFAETSQWGYGWRLKESVFNKNTPKYGRVWVMAREASLSGPKPDPDHYKNPYQNRGPNKCR